MVGVYFVYPLRMNQGFIGVSLSRRFRTPEGIARRVPGVWVLMYNNYSTFYTLAYERIILEPITNTWFM